MIRALLLSALLIRGLFAAHSVELTWTDDLNPAGTTYNLYRAETACTGTPLFAKIVNSIAPKTYTDANVLALHTYCYYVTAFNGLESSPSNSSLAVIPADPPPPPPQLTVTCSAINAVQGVAVTPVSAVASNGTAPYTFASINLPAALGISEAGLISGTVSTAGIYSYTVTATDSAAATASATCAVIASAPPPPPPPPPPRLSVSCSAIYAVQYVPISPVMATAQGGKPPYRFSSKLPARLSMTTAGKITGAVSAAGVFSYTVTVRDAKHASALSSSCSISVQAPTTPAPPPKNITRAPKASVTSTGPTAKVTVK